MLKNTNNVTPIGGMFIEVGNAGKRIEEAKWVNGVLEKSSLTYGSIAGINVAEDVTPYIESAQNLNRVRGFRQMLNFDPAYCPNITENPFENPIVLESMKKIEAAGYIYELFMHPKHFS
jgi:hypothetical protein